MLAAAQHSRPIEICSPRAQDLRDMVIRAVIDSREDSSPIEIHGVNVTVHGKPFLGGLAVFEVKGTKSSDTPLEERIVVPVALLGRDSRDMIFEAIN